MMCHCFLQVLNRHCPANDQSLSSKYFQMRQENDVQTLFPKPIYSYRYHCRAPFCTTLSSQLAVNAKLFPVRLQHLDLHGTNEQ